ncbi:AP2/ERF and B3 domain-containing transcription factor At1g50680-like [Argentina anserina]|uniref:AP2/ERF and B3 domain-containing transcription factor At1g50680-like n=1 Tax=Argentina anserina TaxID=57926 RepID=UPI0021764055|nr:AP2/ERF and B3 domain-containing transcription factor At1g50680-like [Potentilla anserina]
MEDETSSSMVNSGALRNNNSVAVLGETSDSNDTNFEIHPNKRLKHETDASSARFKGVVPQQNGHWGAQIYANHQRIWLGTFKSENEAAMAYDSAAIKLRKGNDSHRNFPWTNLTIQEPDFQNHLTTEEVIKMIRDGSYPSKFSAFVRSQTQSQSEEVGKGTPNQIRLRGNGQVLCRQLFQKELTPSDVGKLNRLVIPKKFAVKYFPCICETAEENGVDDVELVFYDKTKRAWKFRYCYWKSSQSFVFTRGWNRFVKENNLKANDVITFYSCETAELVRVESGEVTTTFSLIDVVHSEGENKKCLVEEEEKLELNLGGTSSYRLQEGKRKQGEDYKASMVEEKEVRLFGVNIN